MQKSYIALSVTACTQSLRSADFVGLDIYVVCLRIVYRRRSCSVKSALDTCQRKTSPSLPGSHSWWSPPLWNTGGWGWKTLCQEGGVAKKGLRGCSSSSRKTVARQRNDSVETCDRFSRRIAWSSSIGRSLWLLLIKTEYNKMKRNYCKIMQYSIKLNWTLKYFAIISFCYILLFIIIVIK